ncbi:hypothetical protein [Noviherbaspirillum sedimenti]|uniref:hypothetical protein n=1 Tax=Noviherbaspirillum sedimenti TaxID=2320865 RepID=UPI0013140CA6|nr:hypothetical protein [Noviherbaspirillum sedimenti]
MKNALIILAMLVVAGCTGMTKGSSSGSMGSDMSSGYPTTPNAYDTPGILP